MQPHGLHRTCENCGSPRYVVDYQRGDNVCEDCGAVAPDHLMLAVDTYKSQYDCSGTRIPYAPAQESIPAGAYYEDCRDGAAQEAASHGKSAPYRRATYFSERVSQWRQTEPDINRDDLRAIFRFYDTLVGRYGEELREYPDGHILTKEDTRKLLWRLDNDEVAAGRKPRFVKCYLVSDLTFLFMSLISQAPFNKHCIPFPKGDARRVMQTLFVVPVA